MNSSYLTRSLSSKFIVLISPRTTIKTTNCIVHLSFIDTVLLKCVGITESFGLYMYTQVGLAQSHNDDDVDAVFVVRRERIGFKL